MQVAPRFERLHIDQVKDCRLEDGSYSNINTIKFNADAYSKFSASVSLPHERMVMAIAQPSSFQQPLRKSTSLARSALSTKRASEVCSAVQGSNHIFRWQSKTLKRAYATALLPVNDVALGINLYHLASGSGNKLSILREL